jgi:transcriptional regulator with XRE-family HTH domain
MNKSPTFKGLFDSVRNTIPYKVEGLIIELTEQIAARLKVLGLSRSAFAERLGTSPAYASKLLSGGTNFTLESLVKVAEALNSEVRVEMVSKDSLASWIPALEKSMPPRRAECMIWAHWQRQNQGSESS